MPKAKMDAIALLKADHRKVEELFEKFEKSRSKKAELAKQICMELTIHMMIEEEIFYPAGKDVVDEDKIQEGYVEHDSAKMMIAEIEAGSPEDEFFDTKVKVLSEEIEHHVKEEEERGGIFSQMKQSDVDLEALGEQLDVRKKQLKAEIEAKGLPAPVIRTMKGGKVAHSQINL